MNNEAALIFAGLSQYDEWEEKSEKSYDLNDLREEYRQMTYSPEGLEMIESFSIEQGEIAEEAGE